MAGNLLLKYASSVVMTTTNLQSLASDQSWLAGWSSAAVDNTSNCYEDYAYGFQFTTHASNRQAGSINIYVIGSLNDTPLWPAVSSGTVGTEGAMAFVDTEERDAICRPLASITVDNSASAVYTFPQTGIAALFGGVPTHHAIFISQNAASTTQPGLASSLSTAYYTPSYRQYT